MVKAVHSLQTKLIVSFLILILVTSGLTFLFTYKETKQSLKEILQEELKTSAYMAAMQVDGDLHETLKEGDETTPEFMSIYDKLNEIRKANEDIEYIYTMRKTPDGVVFVVDADYYNEDDPGGAIEEEYDPTDRLLEGFDHVSVEDEFFTDQWGTLFSGYAPIYDSYGNKVGVLGIDMTYATVLKKQDFIGNTIYLIMGVSLLIAGTIIAIFSMTIIRDIKKLNNIANEISRGKMDVTMDVDRKDEIGELAQSFGRMVASLKIMMMDSPETPKEKKKKR